jgi:hypothetical protein
VRWRHQTTDYGSSEGNWASLLAEITSRDHNRGRGSFDRLDLN